ncbi:MAG: hypothetical protein M1813_004128 [Trichoglossum hirsutum]|nr:MAG: hypothetical protein M1813_004128 [Trichoglossum hirsutum]
MGEGSTIFIFPEAADMPIYWTHWASNDSSRFPPHGSTIKGRSSLSGPESKPVLFKSTLADVYCELRYQRNQELVAPDVRYLDAVKSMIRPEIERMRAHGLHLKGFRRLLLSSIEVEIIEGEAESVIKGIPAIYDKLTGPDIVDGLGHGATLQQNTIFNPFEEGFNYAVIYLFISFVRFRLKRINQSKEAFSHTQDIIGRR